MINPTQTEDMSLAKGIEKVWTAHLHPPVRILLKVSGKVKPSAPYKNKMNTTPKSGQHNLDICVITDWEAWYLISTVWKALPKDFWDREDSALSCAVLHMSMRPVAKSSRAHVFIV